MIYNEEYLNNIIYDRIEENIHLDYKAAGALDKTKPHQTIKDSISKDVAAFANANGGVLIYGLKEDKDNKHLVNEIDPIDRNIISKEWLEQIIQTSIQPRIDGIIIHPIQIAADVQKVAYVVEIPQSNTAHQSSDQRYYKRHNFNNLPMYDHEIRDVMNRAKYPKIILIFYVVTNSFNGGRVYRLNVSAKNEGPVLAQYLMCHVKLPKRCLDEKYDPFDRTLTHLNFDNTYRDVVDVGFGPNLSPKNKYGPARYVPILPLTAMTIGKNIGLHSNYFDAVNEIEWTVYADNAQPINGKLKMVDIPIKS